jgi:hypothetical protein
MILPTGALLGAACVNYSLGVLPTDVQDLTKLGIELAAPGALWLLVRLTQALKGANSGGDSAAAVYGALIERSKQATPTWNSPGQAHSLRRSLRLTPGVRPSSA